MRWLSVLLLLVACKKAPPDQVVEAKVVHPDLHCTGDAIQAGKAPPIGYEAWCHALVPGGKWVRQGPSISWHANEQRSAIGEYESGKRTGHWEFYYATGELEKQGPYVGGVENGVWTTFHPSGARRSEGEMVDGKEHGAWTYWEEDGSWTEGSWQLGERDGVWTEFGPDGAPRSERTYRSGRMVGMREL